MAAYYNIGAFKLVQLGLGGSVGEGLENLFRFVIEENKRSERSPVGQWCILKAFYSLPHSHNIVSNRRFLSLEERVVVGHVSFDL
ncbi:MAG: hypothetical protein GY761_16245 [Hyphomicrobiales bacterium]|nr:hypothetical protein [Hyphomicrobiales bacterium]